MPDVNAAQIMRFEDGGEIIIRTQGGAVNWVVLNVLEGTLTFTPPLRASLPRDVDRGTILNARRRGNQQPGSIGFDIKHTGGIAAGEVWANLMSEGDLGLGVLPAFEIEVNIYRGPARDDGGTKYLFTHCTREEAPVISTGMEFDTMTARFDCTTLVVTAIQPIAPLG